MFIYSDASGIADTLHDAEKFYKFVNGENSKLLNHINTDKNKFSNKDNFNRISIIEQRQLKSYYEKYYENDLEEFYGGKANLEKVKQDYDEDLDYKIVSFVKKIPFLIGFPALITFLLWDSVINGFNTVKNAATKVKYSLVSGWNKITQCIHH